MAEDGNPPASITGRETDASREQEPKGEDLLAQLAQNTSESAGGNVSGTAPEGEGLDIIFVPEGDEEEDE